jgi:hypothetical protein
MVDVVGTLAEVSVVAKRPIKTETVPNPLNNFASYTYALSLWWLDTADYNKLMSQEDVDAALAWEPGSKSYVVAEDSGLYPDRRLPNTPGLNYNIQDVRLNSVVAPNKTSRSSNVLDGSMTIVEQYGVTFIDQLVAASFTGTRFNNYTQQPFMLQIDFKGYDDNGNPIPADQLSTFRKRFPIKILAVKVAVTNHGAEYKIDFCSAGGSAHYPGTHSSTPKNFTVTAGTVKEFFQQLSWQYYSYYVNEVFLGNAEYVESIKFDIDPAIANSSIVNQKGIPINRANSKANAIDFSKSNFTIPHHTPILDIITKVLSHSDYLQKKLKTADNADVSDYSIFNAFKTTAKVVYQGLDKDGNVVNEGVVDGINNRLPMQTTYQIHQYPTWDSNHKNLPKFSDSRDYTVKEYNYFYSGKNIDVIDFKLNFDTTYYTAIQSYTAAIAATESSATTKEDEDAESPSKPHLRQINPAILTGSIPNITPLVYKPIVKDKEASSGLNLSSSPESQVAADVMKAIYTSLNGDMLMIDMTIIGDPTLLKQDDWLYVPSPTNSQIYNAWDKMSQYEYVSKFGSIRMDTGQIVVSVTINTPIDNDSEWVNQGLMTPLPAYSQSLFSGQYKILQIANRFVNGKFEQVLQLARYINSDIASLAASSDKQRSDSVSTNQANQGTMVPSNEQASVRAVDNKIMSGDAARQ